MNLERYELKYLIPEALVDEIRSFIQPYTEVDEFTSDSAKGYIISSLYLDTPTFSFHLAKQRRELNRLKLRIRSYGDGTKSPIFWEIKRKVKRIVHKKRVAVADNWVDAFEMGIDVLKRSNSKNRSMYDEFLYLKHIYQAQPATLVRYRREAYQGVVDFYSRVTFDRSLQYKVALGYDSLLGEEGWIQIDDPISMKTTYSAVVLELKFANQAPEWMTQLVYRYALYLRGFSKYSASIRSCWEALNPSLSRTSVNSMQNGERL